MAHTRRLTRGLFAGLLLAALAFWFVPQGSAERRGARRAMDARQIERELEFAGEMALEGLWREALFRWEKVLPHVEADARLLNNIAVAREAVGDVEGAREAYDRATELAVEKEIETNRSLFLAAQARLEEDETAPPVEDDEGAGE